MKISIIIPAYNVDTWIPIVLNSLIRQDLSHIEIIVIDDGSVDNTNNTAMRILSQSKTPHYKIIKSTNKGVSAARNIGIFESKGKYLYFLDADDFVSETFVNDLTVIIDQQSSDMICWGYNTVTDNNHMIIRKYFDHYDNSTTLMTPEETLKNILLRKSLRIHTNSVIYRREFITTHELLFYEGCINGEDQEFCYKALSQASEIMFINKVLSYAVNRAGSVTNTYNLKRFDAVAALKRTTEYYRDNNMNYSNEIIQALENKVLSNYFANLQFCISASSSTTIDSIYDDIEKLYPGLNDEILKRIKKSKGLDIILLLKITLYRISRNFFLRFFIHYNSLKKHIRGVTS